MDQKILVIAAHPDDEVIGCAGTIAGHTQNKDEVHLLIFTDGVTSRSYFPQQKISRAQELKCHKTAIAQRRTESFAAAEILGV